MNSIRPSPREELSEPLRSIVEDIAREPVPVDLILSRTQRVARPDQRDRRGFPNRKASERATQTRRFSAVLVSLLALGICVMALVFREKPAERRQQIVEQPQPVPPQTVKELPPPTLWAYRQAAGSPEGLDALLIQHATVLLPGGESVSLHPFSRKEEL